MNTSSTPSLKKPFAMLIVMTIAVLGGPVVIGAVLSGGADPRWPPDRPVEWWTFFIVVAVVIGLMAGSIVLSLIERKRFHAAYLQARRIQNGASAIPREDPAEFEVRDR
jgi:hypothetical protein